MTEAIDRDTQERIDRVNREVTFHNLNLEIGSIAISAVQTSEAQLVPLTDAIKSVLESNK